MNYAPLCDYCWERSFSHNKIKMSCTPNGEETFAILCDKCLTDINRVTTRTKE